MLSQVIYYPCAPTCVQSQLSINVTSIFEIGNANAWRTQILTKENNDIMKQYMKMISWSYTYKIYYCQLKILGSYTMLVKLNLTHLPMYRIYASVNWVSIGSDNGLSPIQRQAIIWTYIGLLSIEPLWTNLSEISIKLLNSHALKRIWKHRLRDGGHFVRGVGGS